MRPLNLPIVALLAFIGIDAAGFVRTGTAAADDTPSTTDTADLSEEPASVDVITILGDDDALAHVGGSAHVVTRQKLEEFEYDDIHRVLQQVPGVYFREEDGYGLRPNIGIRGASSERSAKVTLMEDGILFGPAPYAAPAAYYFPLVTRMVGVEVFKGPASIQYGPQTIGGAINLVTRPIPDAPEAAVDLAVGQYESLKVHAQAGGRWRGFGLLVEGVHLGTDGFKELDGGGDTGFTRNEAMLKADYRWPHVTAVDLVTAIKVGYSDEDSDETYLGLTDGDFRDRPLRRYTASGLDRMTWDRWQFQLQQHIRFDHDLDLRFTAYRHQQDRSWRKLNRFAIGAPTLREIFANPTGANAVYLSVLRGEQDSSTPLETLLVGTNAREFVSQGLQSIGDWRTATGPVEHDIEAGVRLHYDEIVRDHTEDPFRMQSGSLERTIEPTTSTADNTGEALALAIHLHNEMRWRRLTVTPGLRFESIWTDFHDRLATDPENRSVSNTQTIVIPGIGAVYFLTDSLSALAGIHRGFSPVAPGQNANADAEDSINYEAGLRWLSPRLTAEAIGFFNDYDNLLATCRLGTGCDPEVVDNQFNGGEVNVYGLELLVSSEFELPLELQFPVSLAYTFTRSEFQSDFSSASAIFGDVEKGDELPYIPEHQVNLTLGLKRGPWGLSSSLTYVGEMRDVAGKGAIPAAERVEDHFVADLTAHWEFLDRGRLYLSFENLTDAEYIVSRRPYGARPGLPFQVWGGVKFRLGG